VVGEGATTKIPTAMGKGINWIELEQLNELLADAAEAALSDPARFDGHDAVPNANQARRRRSARTRKDDDPTVPVNFFPLSREDGDEYFVNLSTGSIESRLALPVMEAKPLEPIAVTVESLEAAFKLAGLETARDEDGDLLVRIYGDEANVLLHAKRPWLQFIKAFQIERRADELLKLAAVNELNQQWEMVRFHIAAPDRLVADYVLPYEQGVSPMQLLLTLQGFVATVGQALRSSAKVKLIA